MPVAAGRRLRRGADLGGALLIILEQRLQKRIVRNAAPPPATPDELWTIVKKMFGVEIVREVHPDCVERGHVAPFDAFADAFFAVNQVDVWQGARGFSGKTYTEAVLCATEEILLACQVGLLGGSLEQAGLAHAYTEDLWTKPGAPTELLLTDPAKRVTRLRNGGGERVLTASMRSVRGHHPPRLRIDEIDEVKIKILDAALGQPMAKGVRGEPGFVASHTLLAGTHHNPTGTMTIVKQRVAERQGWMLHTWCWRESLRRESVEHPGTMIGWLDEAEVDAAKERVPSVMWDIEYEGAEPTAEGRAFYDGIIEGTFLRSLGEFEGEVDEHIEIEAPVAGALYAQGVDWAKTQDYTIVVTLRYDVRPWRVVAFSRQRRRPYPQMVANAEQRLERFGGGGYHDSRGVGAALDDDIKNRDLEGFDTGKRGEGDPMNDYVVDIEHGRIVWPRIVSAFRSHLTATVDDLWGHGHRPDEIVAGMLAAEYARERSDAGDIPAPAGAPGSADSVRGRAAAEDERDARAADGHEPTPERF